MTDFHDSSATRLAGHTDRIHASATVTADGRLFAFTGSEGGTVRRWDLTSHEQVGPPLAFPSPVRALAAAPGGRLVVAHGSELTVLSNDS